MTTQDKPQSYEIFGSDAYAPAEIQNKIEQLGVKKARMPWTASFILAIVAGGSIGFGGMFFAIVLSDAALSFAVQRVLGGLVFTLGLAIVMIAGAELFTGNCLLVMAWASKLLGTREVLRNWVIIWTGNLVGAVGLVALLLLAHTASLNNGAVGDAVVRLAAAKMAPDAMTIFFKAVLCNILVCLAVWLSYAGRSVTDKILGMALPVSAFIAAGFEHCIANMFFLPYGWALVQSGHVPDGVDASVFTLGNMLHNIVPATLGNIVGGAGLVGAIYWVIYRKSLGGKSPTSR